NSPLARVSFGRIVATHPLRSFYILRLLSSLSTFGRSRSSQRKANTLPTTFANPSLWHGLGAPC
ncbi:hypothetical protein DXG03_003625, partial [Asterophora parasitica]